jgi:hypothetical protein
MASEALKKRKQEHGDEKDTLFAWLHLELKEVKALVSPGINTFSYATCVVEPEETDVPLL